MKNTKRVVTITRSILEWDSTREKSLCKEKKNKVVVGSRAPAVCSKYGKKRAGTCHVATGVCFKCGQLGHRIKDCPMWKRKQTPKLNHEGQWPKVHGRVYAITEQDAKTSKTVVAGILSLFSHDAYILIDPGSTHSFIACDFCEICWFLT